MACKAIKKNRKYRFLINGCKLLALISALVLPLALVSCTGPARCKLVLEAKEAIERADLFMGDWQGTSTSHNGTKSPLAAQVIALGKGKYRANFLEEFDTRIPPLAVLEGRLTDVTVSFTGPIEQVTKWQGVIEGGKFTGTFHGRKIGSFAMKKTIRLSPTLGAEPPAKAIVLFNGENFNEWKYSGDKPGPVQWKLVNGAMEVKPGTGSIITKKKFADVKLHLEFRTPFMPKARGQGRGNSGVYLQGRYEVQILDSFGLKGRHNECGGIYQIGAPRVNMCAPPMQWQSYDITFRAPRFDVAGKKVDNAQLSVVHNGVTIHENLAVPRPTTAALDNNVKEPGGVYLQDHGNPVQYRNIWLVELPKERVSR